MVGWGMKASSQNGNEPTPYQHEVRSLAQQLLKEQNFSKYLRRRRKTFEVRGFNVFFEIALTLASKKEVR